MHDVDIIYVVCGNNSFTIMMSPGKNMGANQSCIELNHEYDVRSTCNFQHAGARRPHQQHKK
jgi:hypothetical protein